MTTAQNDIFTDTAKHVYKRYSLFQQLYLSPISVYRRHKDGKHMQIYHSRFIREERNIPMLCPQCNAPMSKHLVQGTRAVRKEFHCTHCKFAIGASLNMEERAILNIQGFVVLQESEVFHAEQS